jgi:alkanesulfonate monooxygenase SsuD/methylene tetrahydromethanopterin reductase-like flavin-dependent oxidoreductase (luciferase family)
MAAFFAKAMAIGGLSMPVAEIAFPCPVRPCFPDLASSNLNGLRLISFLLAHARKRDDDTFWMAEHHFQPEGTELIPNLLTELIPNLLMMAMHLCGVTKNIRIGCGFNIVPMWHPLRLAEDYAMADILTGGRVIFGVGRGYHIREVETFGAPLIDQNANREMFEEGVEILFKAFEGQPFSHQGKYYTIPPEVPYRGYALKEITLVPALQRLPVECWQPIQSGSERAFDFMAKYVVDNHRLAGRRSP